MPRACGDSINAVYWQKYQGAIWQEQTESEAEQTMWEKIIKVRLHEIQTTIARQHGASYDNSGNLSSEALPHTKLQNKYV